MKLFLSSSSEALRLISVKLPKKGKGAKVLFIANAADNDLGDHWWVRSDRNVFEKLGCRILDTDLRTSSKTDFTEAVNSSDVIHFCGGSTLYLMSLIREKGFSDIIADRVRRGKILYSGTSAGSMIAAPKLELCKYDDGEGEYAKEMKDFSGLSLVDFLVIPHCNNKDFIRSTKDMVGHLPENPSALIMLNDSQAVWAEDGKSEVLSV